MSEPALMKFSIDGEKPSYLYVNPEENVFFIGSSIAEIKLRAAALNPNIDICTEELACSSIQDLNSGLNLLDDNIIQKRGVMFKNLIMSILHGFDGDLTSIINVILTIATFLNSAFESAAVVLMLYEAYRILSVTQQNMTRAIIMSSKYSEWKKTFKKKLTNNQFNEVDLKLHHDLCAEPYNSIRFENWRIS